MARVTAISVEAWDSRGREGSIQAFALDARGFRDFRNPASRLRDLPQRDEQYPRLIRLFHRGLEVLFREVGVLAKFFHQCAVVRNARFAFHRLRVRFL
jgi:hypothetical protein